MATLVSTLPQRQLLDLPAQDQRAGRMFPTLPPMAAPTQALQEALLDIGRPGGLLDARDVNPDHPTLSASAAAMAQLLFFDLPFDLESIYQGGPTQARHLYDPVDRGKFKIGAANLHTPLMQAHNHALDIVRGRGIARHAEAFEEARRLMRWHYQWIVLHELLPLYVGTTVMDRIQAEGRRYFVPQRPYVPVEFQHAIGRFWYSMVPACMFDGFSWRTGQKAKRINTRIASNLFQGMDVSPQRLLLGQLTYGLPSGQSVARELRAPILAARDLDELSRYQLGLERDTPLWYYVLKEAHVSENGLKLGPVGGRIVAEVVLGLLQLTPTSYLMQRPRWRPELTPARDTFRMADLLNFAF